jgi:flagellar FliL protein
MAEEEEADGAEAEEGAPGKKRLAGKKIVLFGAAPLLLVIAIGAGLMFSGPPGGDATESGEAEAGAVEPGKPGDVVFYDLPEMLVNLNSGGRQSSFLKIQVSLELDSPESIPRVEAMLPRIIDNFQVYLRELRPDELSGTKGVVRLKEELLARVNTAVEPVRVYDILFKEILVQS